jgi:hypothetical protein
MHPHGQRGLARQNVLYLVRKEHVAVVLAMRVLEEKLLSHLLALWVEINVRLARGDQLSPWHRLGQGPAGPGLHLFSQKK